MGIYPTGVSDDIIALCNQDATIANTLAKAPTTPCHTVHEQLYRKPFVLKRLVNRFMIKHDLYYGRGDPTQEDLDRAEKCGTFPYRPSNLFLKIFSDVLLCLERDPMAGMCAPSLIGTSAVMPLTVLSVIPDIMQHYYDCIVRAEHEVILATNYWQPSNSVDKISQSLKDLSKITGEKQPGKTIVVKIMWDRGQLSQAIDNHAMVDQEGREALKLPKLEEIPNLTLEVINFHRPIMGTFHAKFLIVDRKIALLNSNNIQDRPNLEMMIHLEGLVVDAMYDIFLYSWHHSLQPVLPCLMNPPPPPGKTGADFKFQEDNPYLSSIELVKAAKSARAMLSMQREDDTKLARLREEKEAAAPQGRLQAYVGAFTQSRRGSFAGPSHAEGEAGMSTEERDRFRQAARNAEHNSGEKKPWSFADTVTRAIETAKGGLPNAGFGAAQSQAEDPGQRRKSVNLNGAANGQNGVVNGGTESDAIDSQIYNKEQYEAAQRIAAADLENRRGRSSSESEPATATSQALPIAVTGSQEIPSNYVLPELSLPNSSFTPSSSPVPGSAMNGHAQQSDPNGTFLTSPPTNGAGLSPIPSVVSSTTVNGHAASEEPALPARTSAAHPESAAIASKSGLPNGTAEQPATPTTPSFAFDEPASPPGAVSASSTSTHPRLASSDSQTSLSPSMGSTRTGPKMTIVEPDRGSDPRRQGSQASGLTVNGTTQKRSFIGGKGLAKSASRTGSIRSSKSGKSGKEKPSGPPEAHTPRQRALSTVLNAGALSEAWSTVEDTELLDEFNPHTLHKQHDPFPIAIVGRKPHGLPGHQDIRVPQDAAWLAGFRYAEKSVFIQTPTFNAKPIIAAALAACRRGIIVTIYVDIGFNDKGESMPFQGGTNEEVVEKMYKDLNRTGHQKNLLVYWYTGKDQVRPLNAVLKQRNCHVKFMQVDDQIGIQGNGNQDTQSWYHSCEVNVMVDSAQIVADWMGAIRRQQNTELYGRLDDDGIWRDKATGKTVEEMQQWDRQQEEEARLKEEAEGSGGSTPRRTASRLSVLRGGKKNGSGAGTPSTPNGADLTPTPTNGTVRA